MPPPFKRLSIDEFVDLLARHRSAPGRRRIDAVHMHHTFKPDHGDFRRAAGNEVSVIEGMFRFHTRERGFADIAQHISIDPNGGIWTGRNWNRAPASATGHNGNSRAGPFMFETIGNFDQGKDRLQGRQLDTVVRVIALVQLFFGLPAEALRFHREMASKTCPGSAVRFNDILARVRTMRQQLKPRVDALVAGGGRGADRLFADGAYEVDELTDVLLAPPRSRDDPAVSAVAEDDHDSPDADETATWYDRDDGEGEAEVEVDETMAVEGEPEEEGLAEPWEEAPVPAVNGGRGGRARRVALCVGIDRYATMPLSGCVADARLWATTLERLGFQVRLLLDRQATRRAILTELRRLVDGGRPGDVLVFQYSGHGTYRADTDGDDHDRRDEALVAVDYQQGGLVIDDEQFEIYSRLADGVNLTCFYDCCHSGTAARMALGFANALPGVNARVRFLSPTREMLAAFERPSREGRRSRAGTHDVESLKAIVFSACQDHEFAMEVNGQGVFTGHAARLLSAAVGRRTTNEQFHQAVVGAFGMPTNQNPNFEARRALRGRGLLQPLARGGRPGEESTPAGGDAVLADLVEVLRELTDRLQPGAGSA